MEETLPRRRVRFITRWWIIAGLAVALSLIALWLPAGPARITGRRVFGRVLVVSPPQPGDTHRISERQARTALDEAVSGYSSQHPRLLLFGFGRFTELSISGASPVVKGPAWIGIYRGRASEDLFFGCADHPVLPAPPKPPDVYFAIVIDPDHGSHTVWPDNSAYMAWACSTGHARL